MTTQADTIVWLRNDLRIHDHEPLHCAISQHKTSIAIVYCVDPRQFEKIDLGWHKTGAYRAQFLIETLTELRQTLRRLGSDLIIRCGHPETCIPELAEQLGVRHVFWHEEATSEELAVDAALMDALEQRNVNCTRYWGSTLYHIDDLPFEPEDLPSVFTPARKAIERSSRVRDVFPTPTHLPVLPSSIDPGELPSLASLGLNPVEVDERVVLEFVGGERSALERIQRYMWDADALRHYKETRNGMLKPNASSKFSPWLAIGALSPRTLYWEIKRYEAERVKNDSTYWLIFELIWRDYFRFLAVEEGERLFYRSGIKSRHLSWGRDRDVFWRWVNGQTGVPFVDAHMRELRQTGFMSNRGRQNVASFLAKHLMIDWRWGASYFESQLIDYDPCSNWGNWQYVSGVGNDPRDRKFNVIYQGQRYDPRGAYIKRWLPELERVPDAIIHAPYEEDPHVLTSRYGVTLGVDYPEPLIRLTGKS